MRSFLLVCTSLTVICGYSDLARAGCEVLADKQIGNGQLWVKVFSQWRNFNQVLELPPSAIVRRLPFIYVVGRTNSDGFNIGTVLIKSGRKNAAGAARGPGTVALLRDNASAKAYCETTGNSEVFETTAVNKKAYDEYHDYGYGENKTSGGAEFARVVKDFHIGMKRPNSTQCIKSDSVSDYDGNWVSKNIRSQFSFNTKIVDDGMSAPFVVAGKTMYANIFTSGLAGGSDGFHSQRSEIKSYELRDGLACVQFYASVAPNNFIVRVNDLGARVGGVMGTEVRWER